MGSARYSMSMSSADSAESSGRCSPLLVLGGSRLSSVGPAGDRRGGQRHLSDSAKIQARFAADKSRASRSRLPTAHLQQLRVQLPCSSSHLCIRLLRNGGSKTSFPLPEFNTVDPIVRTDHVPFPPVSSPGSRTASRVSHQSPIRARVISPALRACC